GSGEALHGPGVRAGSDGRSRSPGSAARRVLPAAALTELCGLWRLGERCPRDPYHPYAAIIPLEHRQLQPADVEAVPRLRNRARAGVEQPRQRLESAVARQVDAQRIVDLLDAGLGAHLRRAVRSERWDGQFRWPALLPQLADDGLEDVFQRDDAGEAPVLVGHHDDV